MGRQLISLAGYSPGYFTWFPQYLFRLWLRDGSCAKIIMRVGVRHTLTLVGVYLSLVCIVSMVYPKVYHGLHK